MNFTLVVFLIAILGVPAPPVARGYYAAATGSRAGDGSLQRPWDLATALGGGSGAARVAPGDTVWVRGGRYRGPLRSTLRGSESQPVVVRAYGDERAIIDGAGTRSSTFQVTGEYSVFWGLEFTNSDPVRRSAGTSHDARPDVVVNNASHTKYVNLVIHDGGTALYTEPAFVDVEIAGCIIFNNGWQGPDRGHGHGLYLKSFVGPLVVRDNVIFNQYGYGVHAYSNANSGRLVNIRIEGNVAFNSGTLSDDRTAPNILLGGAAYATGDVVRANVTYFPPAASGTNVRIGFGTLLNGDVQVDSNLFVGGSPVLEFGFWQAALVSANTFVGTGGGAFVTRRQAAAPGHIFRANSEERRPSGVTVVVRPNPYAPGRASATVLNWARQDHVDVPLSGVLTAGDRYEIRSVQDLFGKPLASGVFSGAPARVPMNDPPSTTIPTPPVGMRVSRAPRTTPEFDVFLITRVPGPTSTR